ncbi:MAG: Ig-like domain-containing protein [Candidatus Sericytochromatia bacterium]|nr:Ig-like domain-containing protein [Candidatus Tanganyikabacteria bacterium]
MSFRATGSADPGAWLAGGLVLLALAIGCSEQPGGINTRGGTTTTSAATKAPATGAPDLSQGSIEGGGTPAPSASAGAGGGTATPTPTPMNSADHASHHPSPTPTPTEPPILERSYGIEVTNLPAGGLQLFEPPGAGAAHASYPSTFQFQVKVTLNTGISSNASWSIAPANIATISAGNKLTALKAGTATITVRATDGQSAPLDIPLTVKAEGGIDAEVL